jgi:uncharacterized protein YbbC (DUF1343 family)
MKLKFLLILVIYTLTYIPSGFSETLFGIDVLQKSDFKELEGARVGLITNHTGLNHRGESTVDLLHEAKDVKLVSILSPEHGFRGTAPHGKGVGEGIDPNTNLPVYSLYGNTTRPTDEMLKNIDTLVFDIQDIGTRFYTYITTMGQALEESSQRGIRFVVLDRPNPITGEIVEGDILDPKTKRFTGYFSIPTRHGLTVGEIAHWMNQTQALGSNLKVIKMKKWKRKYWFDETGQTFRPTSPNIPDLTTALLYSGIGCFEATNVSVGRGTRTPFKVIGAPWMNGRALCAHLRTQNFPGVVFEATTFIPQSDLYKGESCQGIKIMVTNRKKIRPFTIFLSSFIFLMENHPEAFQPDWEEIRIVTGSEKLHDVIKGNWTYEDLLKAYEAAGLKFKEEISPFYLY